MNTVKKLSNEEADIRIDAEGILRVHLHEGIEIDLDMLMMLLEKYRELGMGPGKEKRLELMTSDGTANINREAREHIALHGKDYFIAAALVNTTLASRLLVNFFNQFYNHQVPFKLFASEEKAMKWLRTLKNAKGEK
jgi:hypothetical protein